MKKQVANMEASGIGVRINSVRKTNTEGAYSIQDFSDKIGVHKSTVARYEREDSFPDANIIMSICNNFNINPNWLLTGDGPRQKPAPPVGYTKAHHELRERLKRKIRNGTLQFFLQSLGPDAQKARDYMFERYLPSDEELEKICESVHDFDSNTVKSGRKVGEYQEQDREYLEGITKTKTTITDSELLSNIISVIEDLSENNDIALVAEKKAELISLLYEEIAENEDKIPLLKRKAVRLFNLAAKI
jgi:transcriptional regulator with XRE-family HTH domain